MGMNFMAKCFVMKRGRRRGKNSGEVENLHHDAFCDVPSIVLPYLVQ